jgi:hypothetical protein
MKLPIAESTGVTGIQRRGRALVAPVRRDRLKHGREDDNYLRRMPQ